MNIGKNVDNGSLFAGLDRAMASQLSQIELYCEIGRLICARPEKGAAVAAAAYLAEKYLNQAGFSARSVRRMRDFYRTYEKAPKLLAQAMRLGWTQNVVILEADLTMEERAWYLRAAEQFGWSKLTLQKKIAEAAHLTEVLDLASEMCYTEQNEAATMSFAQNDTGRQLLLQLRNQYEKGKHLKFAPPILQRHMGREPPRFQIPQLGQRFAGGTYGETNNRTYTAEKGMDYLLHITCICVAVHRSIRSVCWGLLPCGGCCDTGAVCIRQRFR